LLGEVNGHWTVELGEPGDVRAEVQRAVETFAPGEGFVLSPVENVHENPPISQANVVVLIDEWKQISGQ
jgi:hypothetical protein